jgi:acyl-homoserine lactone acylase PvdQ
MLSLAGPLTALALLTPALPAAEGAAAGPAYRQHDYADGQARYVLPPGENGLVNATDALAFETTGQRPANSQDQLGLYTDLLYGYPHLTDGTLSRYFNDESFGVRPQDVTRTEHPGDGVTIYRDTHGVPHIYGDTDDAAAFGAGYAQAEDRLFLMDVLRHYGSGTLASFLGASCEFEQMDHDQLLLAPYTKEQAQRQVDLLPKRYGKRGELARSMIESYVDGVNAYVQAAQLDPTKLPADYLAGAPDAAVPQPWSAADVVHIAGLIGGIFGRGGGFETDNAHLLTYLQGRYGAKAGLGAYRDLNHQNNPLAPTTITDRRFRYDVRTRAWDRSLNAIPGPRPLVGGPASTSTGCGNSSGLPTGSTSGSTSGATSGSTSGLTTRQRIGMNIISALRSMPRHMSNALVVNGSQTRSGHPVAVFGPQVSYFAPQILSLLDLHSPHYDAMGASFPGTGLVELGRGRDYAWSATSAGSDVIDQRVERICDPSGGTPAATGTAYVFEGRCVPMMHETFSETVLPKAGSGGGLPATIDHEIYRTRHGVVQGWTKVHGHPVAIVNQRSTYNHDVDSVVGFLGFGDPRATHDVHSWMWQANRIGYTFNWFYVDDRDTGYFVSGRDPRRNPHADPTLPTWGTGRSEWRGFLSFREHPHEVNPRQGFFVSWNNKPAPGFAVDGEYAGGQTYRSVMLVRQLERQLRETGGQLTRADVVQAMETAASQDLDGLEVTPLLLRYLRGHPQPAHTRAMLRELRAWVADGAHRRKAAPSGTQYRHHAAIAINDELMPRLVRAFYDRILAEGGMSGVVSTGGASVPGYAKLPMQWVNTPNSGGAHLGSAYDGGYEGYLMSTLQQLLGRHPADGFGRVLTRHECGGGPATCRRKVAHALATTYAALVAANGNGTVASWTDSTDSRAAGQTMPAYDSIGFQALGLVGQPNIDWQNRPTFQQVVEFPRHRPRPSR